MMKKTNLILIGLIIACLVGFAAYEMRQADESSALSSSGIFDALQAHATGDMEKFRIKADAGPLPLDMPLDGKTGKTSLRAQLGPVLLVNLWAEWCAPCIREMPTLAALQRDMGGAEFRVLPISINQGTVKDAQDVLEGYGAGELETLSDPTLRLMSKLGVSGLPTTILITPDGHELGRLVGPAEWDGPDAKALMKVAIEAAGTGSSSTQSGM